MTANAKEPFSCKVHGEMMPYNQVISFTANPDLCIHFPDFTLRALGTHHHTPSSPKGLHIIAEQFAIEDPSGNSQKIEWASTGEIAAVEFEANGKTFYLEMQGTLLSAADANQPYRLARDQMVILTAEFFNMLMLKRFAQ